METIKVNMTPCEDVKTIHASQNDNEGREWGFILHNNGDVIDSSEITDQITFKAYKGGTEQILPENGAVPVTAPFVGDIKYPDATRNVQEFLYRQSPTEEDGNAKIKSLYGNTLVWNQLAEITKATATINDVTFTNSNNQSISVSGTASANCYFYLKGSSTQRLNVGKGKILLKGCPNGGGISTFRIALRTYINGTATWISDVGNGVIFDCDEYIDNVSIFIGNGITVSNLNFVPQIFNLTQMGLDSLTVDEFTSLFSKTYYDYCKGAMLSFGGRNVKFKQLMQNGNFASTSGWASATPSQLSIVGASNNRLLFTCNNTEAAIMNNGVSFPSSHKLLFKLTTDLSNVLRVRIYNRTWTTLLPPTNLIKGNGFQYLVINPLSDAGGILYIIPFVYDNVQHYISNVQVFDLTEMFGAGNEPSAEGFKEFPNDYYEYTTGQYMNLGQPVSLKTTGKNQVTNIVRGYFSLGASAISVDNDSESVVFYAIKGKTYVASSSVTLNRNAIARCETPNLVNGSPVYDVINLGNNTEKKWTATWTGWTVWYIYNSRNETVENSAQVEFGTTATAYEPYTESVINLSISQYFPNGMDGINDARDEKNETGYVKRIGKLNIDSSTTIATWESSDGWTANIILDSYKANGAVKNDKFEFIGLFGGASAFATSAKARGGDCLGALRNANRIYFYSSSATTSNELINAIRGTKLYYELATPLENYGVVDLGTLTWVYSTQGFFLATINDIVQGMSSSTVNPNVVSDMYAYKGASGWTSMPDMSYGFNNTEIRIKNTAYSTADAFKSAMSGVYLLYEKENPQGFTTAALVTENGEVALANENGVLVGKCTEQLSSESGFFDAKIKLADSDGECYSNKIQLHVERSPQ